MKKHLCVFACLMLVATGAVAQAQILAPSVPTKQAEPLTWKTYTDPARQAMTVGTVVLKVVFSSSGSVINISTVEALPHGLTEQAVAAARKIKFIPAIKDGRYVSMWMQLEYNFSLY